MPACDDIRMLAIDTLLRVLGLAAETVEDNLEKFAPYVFFLCYVSLTAIGNLIFSKKKR